jgi:pSer/pThr/pTyr-binding forkhead associated (FHA) protein
LGLDERAEVGLFGDALVARRHAEIEDSPQGYILRSFASAGRTHVNGQELSGERTLHDGDRIELGRTQLLFRQRGS